MRERERKKDLKIVIIKEKGSKKREIGPRIISETEEAILWRNSTKGEKESRYSEHLNN